MSDHDAAAGHESRHVITAGLAATMGYLVVSTVIASSSRQLLPWVLGRGLGVAAYLALWALTLSGLWLRHPWRIGRRWPSSEMLHATHAVLSPLALLLVAGHVVALSVDRFAGVGWTGAAIPGSSGYRPLAVALGTISVYAGLIVAGTATFAGWFGRRVWLPVHRLAAAVLVLAWFHAILAGSDETALRPLYVVTAVVVVASAVTRRLARVPDSMLPAPSSLPKGS